MASKNMQAVQLSCAVQSYAWGKIGSDSTVAQLAQSNPGFKLDNNKPYAELWMGTHPNGPSMVIADQGEMLLSDWIATDRSVMGDKVNSTFGGSLPFLFKVLSVNKSLSIQAHPNKSHAEQLHASRPDVYKDPNHKPEMAIALTQFEGMCGFRPISDIQGFLRAVPEFAEAIGQEAASAIMSCSAPGQPASEALKIAFTSLMTSDGGTVARQLSKVLGKITEKKASGQEISDCLGELFLRVHSQFPGDVGCFCIYFLNHVTLQPGQAMFLGPNLPHAYLYGDCMECMACSDNVVRAGLTPKFKDVTTLCGMLDYKPATAEENIFPSVQDPNDQFCHVYDPPVKDFSVERIELPESFKGSYQIKPLDGPSILIDISGIADAVVTCGTAIHLEMGAVIFIPANSSVALENRQGSLLLFRAFCAL